MFCSTRERRESAPRCVSASHCDRSSDSSVRTRARRRGREDSSTATRSALG